MVLITHSVRLRSKLAETTSDLASSRVNSLQGGHQCNSAHRGKLDFLFHSTFLVSIRPSKVLHSNDVGHRRHEAILHGNRPHTDFHYDQYKDPNQNVTQNGLD